MLCPLLAIKPTMKMKNKYIVRVETGKYGERHHPYLCDLGLLQISENVFSGEVSARVSYKIKRFCKENQLKFIYVNEYGYRGEHYRKDFFQNNKPIFYDSYFCAYCGKVINKKNMTVDHIYPIDKVRSDLRLQKKLKRMGIEDVNAPQNLVAACKRCNQKKGTNMGLWVLKGKIGKSTNFWHFRWIVRTIIITLIICTLVEFAKTFIILT